MKAFVRVALLVALALALAACGGGDDQAAAPAETAAAETTVDVAASIDAELETMEGEVQAVSPADEPGQPLSAAELTSEEEAQVKKAGLKAAFAAHYLGDAHIVGVVNAAKAELKRLGIELVASTSADFDAAKQTEQIDTILAKDVDILLSLPVDPVATKGVFERARDKGVKLVFMDHAPQDFVAGTDYVSVVSDDRLGQGVVNGLQMAKAINGKGKVGLIFHDADFWITEQTYIGVKRALEQYPDIEVVEQGVLGPDFAGEAQTAASAMLLQNPDLDLIWAVWDLPGEGVLAALRAEGKQDVKLVTLGIAPTMSIELLKGGLVEGLTAFDSAGQGRGMVQIAAKAALGQKDLPGFIAANVKAVDATDDIVSLWEKGYATAAPKEIVEAQKAAQG
jgi:ribose transport system substrate-binding protein